jgi:hypothetical protein
MREGQGGSEKHLVDCYLISCQVLSEITVTCLHQHGECQSKRNTMRRRFHDSGGRGGSVQRGEGPRRGLEACCPEGNGSGSGSWKEGGTTREMGQNTIEVYHMPHRMLSDLHPSRLTRRLGAQLARSLARVLPALSAGHKNSNI